MKIEKLIEIFEQCIPTYQKCVDEKWSIIKIRQEDLDAGICCFCDCKLNESIYNAVDKYYKYYKEYHDYFYITAKNLYFKKKENLIIKQAIQPRLKFLKQQVKELKKLQKQGYTHV